MCRGILVLPAGFVLAVAFAPDTGAQTLVSLVPPPGVARSGEAFSAPPTIRLDADSRVGRTLVASLQGAGSADPPPRLIGSVTATTDTEGVATFSGLGIEAEARSWDLHIALADDPTTSDDFSVRVVPGTEVALRVTETPCDSMPAYCVDSTALAAGKRFHAPWRVALVDRAGNVVPKAGVTVNVSLPMNRGDSLIGTTSVTTSREGIATFGDLAIDGDRGRYQLTFGSDGLRSDVASAVPVDRPDFDSHLVIGAIKTISGVDPEDEFLDLNFVFPIHLRSRLPHFVLASIDVALNKEQSRLLELDASSTQADTLAARTAAERRLTEASLSWNFMLRPTNAGARKAFAGLAGRIFDGDFLLGAHWGSIELRSSALHGSYMTFGYLHQFAVPDEIPAADGSLVENEASGHHLAVSFLGRSDDAPFLSVMNIRGTVLIPIFPTDPPIRSRIVLSVPFAGLFRISEGH